MGHSVELVTRTGYVTQIREVSEFTSMKLTSMTHIGSYRLRNMIELDSTRYIGLITPPIANVGSNFKHFKIKIYCR